jgi:hypothetical protein
VVLDHVGVVDQRAIKDDVGTTCEPLLNRSADADAIGGAVVKLSFRFLAPLDDVDPSW